MSKILYVNGCKVETKWEKLKRKTSEKAKSAMQWINQNKEMIVVLVPVATTKRMTVSIFRSISRPPFLVPYRKPVQYSKLY